MKDSKGKLLHVGDKIYYKNDNETRLGTITNIKKDIVCSTFNIYNIVIEVNHAIKLVNPITTIC